MIWPTLPVEQLKSKVTVGYSNRYNQCTRPLTSNSPYKPNQRPLPPPGAMADIQLYGFTSGV